MILRDPVHGLMPFDTEEDAIVVRLLGTAEVQRLRRIRQLGVTSLAFPGAEHTRFAHALGAAHVMKRLVSRLRQIDGELPFWQRVSTERAREALAAALLHDVGHGPLSHLFEAALPHAPEHEEWTTRIVLDPGSEVHRVLAAEGAGLPARVAELVHGRHEVAYLARAVSGTLDVDRCDYLLRDAHATGVRWGQYDLDWLLHSLRFAPPADDAQGPALAIDGKKGLAAFESFLLARLFMFQQVYFHKTTRAAEWMIGAALARAGTLLRDGTKLPATPEALAVLATGGQIELGAYLELDDAVLWGAMHAWESGPDVVLADLCRRIRARSLYKTLDVDPADEATRTRMLDVARDVARAAGLEPDVYVGLDVARDVPFSEEGESLRVLLRGGQQRRPGDVSFLLGRLRDEPLVQARLLFAPELRDAVHGALGA